MSDEITEKQIEKQSDKPWLFKPGQSGNPKGRPKKEKCLTPVLCEMMDQVCPQDKEGRTWKQVIVLATLKLGLEGNSSALREIWERIDGKVAQEISGPEGGPIEIENELIGVSLIELVAIARAEGIAIPDSIQKAIAEQAVIGTVED